MKKVLLTLPLLACLLFACNPQIEDEVLPIEKEMTSGGDDGVIHSDEGEATSDPLPPPSL